MRRTATGVLLAAVLVVAAGCSGEALQRGGARLTVSQGSRVLVAERGQRSQRADGNRTLGPGARVEVLTGSATLALPRGSVLEVRRGSKLELGPRPLLLAGDLLVVAERSPVTVEAAGSRVTIPGVARLSRDLALSAASYRGGIRLESAGRLLGVPALRQAAIPSLGVIPANPEPLAYDARDPWDRRFLGEAIELGDELEAKSRGFTSSLRRGEGRTPGFFRLLVPELEAEPDFGPQLLSSRRSPGETLVGAVIAANGRRGAFLSRWSSVFAFREQGAAWGLVALDQGVTGGDGLVRSLDAAISRAPLAFVPPPPTTAPAPRPTPVRPPVPPTTAATTTSAPPPRRVAPPPPPPAPPPGPLPQPPPTRTPLDPVVEPLIDVINGLLGGRR